MLFVIDQGTTSTRVALFNSTGQVIAQEQIELRQYYPEPGWVEHDPEEIWQAVLDCGRLALQHAKISAEKITAIGITNQRETTILWDKNTGKPIHKAIVWQDRRTADMCRELREHENLLQQKTGLVLDPYFSATKIRWLLDHADIDVKNIIFGTIETFLLWRLTKGQSHFSDITNASRTALFNIRELKWDTELLNIFNIPVSILPQVKPNPFDFGFCDPECFGAAIPITAMIGDQQAAAIGQACISPGLVKSTYGTGCFMLMNTGKMLIQSKNRLLSTIAYQIDDQLSYAMEGSIFVAGAAIQWLRDNLKIIQNSSETAELASSVADNGGVYFVPAFTGLGAPYWEPEVRAAIFGLTRDTRNAHIARAALEGVCYETKDLLLAIENDGVKNIEAIRVDGGMAANDWMMQFLANIINIPVERATNVESTSLGAAFLAGLKAGIYTKLEDINNLWHADAKVHPRMKAVERDALYSRWKTMVKALRMTAN